MADYKDASFPSQRELLAISEALRMLESRNVSDRNEVIPICFFEASKAGLLDPRRVSSEKHVFAHGTLPVGDSSQL